MANDVDVNLFSWTQSDAAGEKTSTTVNLISQPTGTDYVTARNAYVAAINAITDGLPVQRTASATEFLNAGKSSTPSSHREQKILIRYRDNVTNRAYSVTLGCRDDSVVTYVPGTDLLDMTATLEGNVKTAFEAFVASPNGNPVTVYEMVAVGRNL